MGLTKSPETYWLIKVIFSSFSSKNKAYNEAAGPSYLCKCNPITVRVAQHVALHTGLQHVQCTLMDGLQEI